jgi:DNA gyrase subunit A
VPADQVRLTGRTAMGVTLFRLDAGERVTSVFPVLDDGEADNGEPAADKPPPADPDDGDG